MNFVHKQRKRRKQENKDQKMIGPHFVTFRRSSLFEVKCQRMSMARCLWGLEKYYRLKLSLSFVYITQSVVSLVNIYSVDWYITLSAVRTTLSVANIHSVARLNAICRL